MEEKSLVLKKVKEDGYAGGLGYERYTNTHTHTAKILVLLIGRKGHLKNVNVMTLEKFLQVQGSGKKSKYQGMPSRSPS